MQVSPTFASGFQWKLSALLAAVLSCPLSALAQQDMHNPPDPVFDGKGHTQRKIIHRLSPEINLQSPFSDKASVTAKAPSAGSTAQMSPAIKYNGGPVMATLSQVVLIWYGNWNQNNGSDTPAGQQIIRDAIYGLSSANTYSGITVGSNASLGSYTGPGGVKVTQASSARMTETSVSSATYGTTLSDANVLSLVQTAAGNTPDADAIYFVLSSSDIGESSGFLTSYCGWHTYATIAGSKVKYGFIGNPAKGLSACAAQTTSPNGNAGVDAMISVIAHELVETVSDPLLNAWFNGKGYENSDMCAWTFGQKLSSTSGAYWNVSLPTSVSNVSRNYLLQRQLAPKNSKCYVNASSLAQ